MLEQQLNEYSGVGVKSEIRDSMNQNNRNLLQNLQGKSMKKFSEGVLSNSKKISPCVIIYLRA